MESSKKGGGGVSETVPVNAQIARGRGRKAGKKRGEVKINTET